MLPNRSDIPTVCTVLCKPFLNLLKHTKIKIGPAVFKSNSFTNTCIEELFSYK